LKDRLANFTIATSSGKPGGRGEQLRTIEES
jgi:hypothetical protein